MYGTGRRRVLVMAGAIVVALLGAGSAPVGAAPGSITDSDLTGSLAVPMFAGSLACAYDCSGTFMGFGSMSAHGILNGQPVSFVSPTGVLASTFYIMARLESGGSCLPTNLQASAHFGGGAVGTYGTTPVVGVEMETYLAADPIPAAAISPPVFELATTIGLAQTSFTLHLQGGAVVSGLDYLPFTSWGYLAMSGGSSGSCPAGNATASFSGSMETTL